MLFYKKLIKTNIILCMVFFVLFSIVTTLLTTRYISSEAESSSNIILEQVSSSTKNDISKIMNTLYTIIESTNIKNFVNKQDPQKVLEYKMDLNSLIVKSFTPSHNSKIAVIDIYENIVLANTGTMTVDFFNESNNIPASAFSENAANDFREASFKFSMSEDNKKLILYTCKKKDVTHPIFAVSVLPVDELFVDTKGQITISFDDTVIFGNYDKSDKYHTVYTKADRIHGLPVNIKYSLYVDSRSTLLLAPLLTVGMIMLVIMIICLLLTYELSKRTYNPIKKLLSLFSQDSFNENENEIELIRERFIFLDNAKQTAEKNAETALFRNQLYGLSDNASLFEKYGLTNGDMFICSIIELVDTNSTISSERLLNTLSLLILHDFSAYKFVKIIPIDFNRDCMLICCKDFNMFVEALKHSLVKISPKANTEITASVGTIEKGYSGIAKSFANAFDTSANHIHELDIKTVYTFDDLLKFNHNTIFYPIESENNFIKNITSCNYEVAINQIERLINMNFVNKSYSETQFSHFVLLISNSFNRILSSLGESAEKIFGEGVIIYLELKSAKTPDELLSKIKDMSGTLIQYIENMQSISNSRLCNAMLDYISESYTQNISLTDLAEHLNLSLEYTSRQFKQLTGQNFKDYLMRYRFDMAVKIMENTPHEQINNIATAVGCTNSAMLSRIFIKFTGMSASEYMKKLN